MLTSLEYLFLVFLQGPGSKFDISGTNSFLDITFPRAGCSVPQVPQPLPSTSHQMPSTSHHSQHEHDFYNHHFNIIEEDPGLYSVVEVSSTVDVVEISSTLEATTSPFRPSGHLFRPSPRPSASGKCSGAKREGLALAKKIGGTSRDFTG